MIFVDQQFGRQFAGGLALVLLLAIPARAAPAPPSWSLLSPNRKVAITVSQKISGTSGNSQTSLVFRVDLNRRPVIEDSDLGVQMAGGSAGNFRHNLQFQKQSQRRIDQFYRPLAAKRSLYRSFANEKVLSFANPSGRIMELVLRAQNDGIAYRYRFLGSGPAEVIGEDSSFVIPSGARGWLQPSTVNHSFEADFVSGLTAIDLPSGIWSQQSLFQLPHGTWLFLAEAEVRGNYHISYFRNDGGNTRRFQIHFPVSSSQSTLPWETPWRSAVIASNLLELTETTLIENLNAPSAIGDVRWIRPGRVAWSWWYDRSTVTNLTVQKQLVDFAAEMGWEYTLLDEGTPQALVPEITEYAQKQKIGVILWSHWRDLDTPQERLEKFPLWKSWGIQGLKIDYIEGVSQERMQFYESLLSEAVPYQFLVNFHGSSLPTGRRRTWPHLLTSEAVKATEYYPSLSARYHTILPFTRNLLGPMDFTPGVVSESRNTSLGHQLALTVLYQSGWQHFPDAPAKYAKAGWINWLKQLPADWDYSRLIDGYPGEFAVMVRRKGNDWFVGGISGDNPWNVGVPLRFLPAGKFQAEIYQDTPDGNAMTLTTQVVTRTSSLVFPLRPSSGFGVRLTRKK